MADAALSARQRALGIDRELDAVAAEGPARDVLVLAIYATDGDQLDEALRQMRQSRHRVTAALGAMGPAAPGLAQDTVLAELRGGKFGNLNLVAQSVEPSAADWILLVDDDITIPDGFLDRLLAVAERFDLGLAQPALSRASYGWYSINRRHTAICRQTRFVEIGPVILLRRDVYQQLAPFPEEGMGWGLDLHWSAVAERLGWRLGVIDAVPVRHETRRYASAIDIPAAYRAAEQLLANREHVTYIEAEAELARHRRLRPA
jgi:hypothetical protein